MARTNFSFEKRRKELEKKKKKEAKLQVKLLKRAAAADDAAVPLEAEVGESDSTPPGSSSP